MSDCSEPYLELSENPVRFEAVNQVTNVFFDDSNKQASCVRIYYVLSFISHPIKFFNHLLGVCRTIWWRHGCRCKGSLRGKSGNKFQNGRSRSSDFDQV